MLQYLFKRIFIFLPTLFVISLLAFGLSRLAPGDPVELQNSGGGTIEHTLVDAERVYRETAQHLGLDKPTFYFAFAPLAYPDTLYRILKRGEREMLGKLVAQYGNWEAVEHYYHTLLTFNRQVDTLQREQVRPLRASSKQLYLAYRHDRVTSLIDQIVAKTAKDSTLNVVLHPQALQLASAYQAVVNETTPHLLYIPDLKWQGWDNQYHHWLIGFLQFDFGTSYFDGRPVASRMKEALKWTILINLLAVGLAYLLSVPIGVLAAARRGDLFDRSVTVLLFILYSLPNFWIATILVVFFTTPEYGMNWFPSGGLGDLPSSAPFWSRFWETAAHLVLPIFCLTYTSLAYISRQVRGGMLGVIGQDYVRTARAKGLRPWQVIWKHSFRNALFPLITMFASIFPAVFAGSVVIEVIFNIPGMGKLSVEAIFQRDWPVVYTVLMLSAILTMVGILLADLLYAWVDPRISYNKTSF